MPLHLWNLTVRSMLHELWTLSYLQASHGLTGQSWKSDKDTHTHTHLCIFCYAHCSTVNHETLVKWSKGQLAVQLFVASPINAFKVNVMGRF